MWGIALKNKKVRLKRKALLITAISLTAAFVLSTTVYAWFTNQRRLETMTRISSPSSLYIGAGAKEDSANIDMGGIDVTDATGKKDFVFCVYSDETVGNYKLQLAHTTNIDFTYTIFRATESDTALITNDMILYVDESGVSHYYAKDGTALPGGYLNLGGDGKTANGTLHDKSYDGYDLVQKNAEPLYWQNRDPITHDQSMRSFVDYYILEVSWNSSEVSNNKETDMVYLTAGMV